VGSLLEVGTGFHPELTGRENIYMNGSVLGMTRREIRRKFDEIVEFSGVEKFLDTPTKRYSSGMQVRLAFAVAAHLESEILVVDEVLAVGDMEFQRKCIGKMGDVARSGRTVLFVSHNMVAIESLCETALLLERGIVEEIGNVDDIIQAYCRKFSGPSLRGRVQFETAHHAAGRGVSFVGACLVDECGEPVTFTPMWQSMRIRIEIRSNRIVEYPTICISFDDDIGQRLLSVLTPLSRHDICLDVGHQDIECSIPNFPLAPGEYWVKLGLAADQVLLDSIERAFSVSVVDGDAFEDGRGFHRGICIAPSYWRSIQNHRN
jgi:lipopolysaccharide transport system ATP-binding protein